MEEKHKKRLKEISAGEKGRLIQTVAHYCGTWPTGSNTTTGQIRKIVEVLKEIHKRIPVERNMEHRSISDQLSTEDSTSKKYKVGRLGTAGGAITRHYCLLGLGAGLQMARERWRSIRGTRRKP